MDLLYILVLAIVRLYRFGHLIYVKLTKKWLKPMILAELDRIGVHVEGPVVGEGKNEKNSKSGPTIKIHDNRFFERITQDRALGFAESYIEGYWDCDEMAVLSKVLVENYFFNFCRHTVERFIYYLEHGFFNLQTTKRAYQVAENHYDLGNKLFESFLDPSMNYSCGYWKNARDLAEAQQHKMELIAKKLKLEPGMRVLDIGCGWGGLCQYLAEKHHVTVVGINIAKEGVKEARELCKGLDVEIRCMDYREMNEKFDRIVSVGMFEHVGAQNYKDYFEMAHKCLVDHGIFLLHTSGVDDDDMVTNDSFMNKYIFRNGVLPRSTEITSVTSKYFTMEDWHNFGHDYSQTLLCWNQNFVQNWPSIKRLVDRESEKFYRIWTYYFQIGAGCYQARRMQLWQIVFTKNGYPGGYESIR